MNSIRSCFRFSLVVKSPLSFHPASLMCCLSLGMVMDAKSDSERSVQEDDSISFVVVISKRVELVVVVMDVVVVAAVDAKKSDDVVVVVEGDDNDV
jgi:branched-subunit amino acid transport protein